MMIYISVKEVSEKWHLSERSIRNYCAEGRIVGAVLNGKTWMIPSNAERPDRKKRDIVQKRDDLLTRLMEEKKRGLKSGIYHDLLVNYTYHSSINEGSSITYEQTKYLYETNTIGVQAKSINVDDLMSTMNHFRCIDSCIDLANYRLSETFIRQLHRTMKSGTSDAKKPEYPCGEYRYTDAEDKLIPSEIATRMKRLLTAYNLRKEKTFEEILEFLHAFDEIWPFVDENGRIERLLLLKECLRNGVTPFIIEEDEYDAYCNVMKEWDSNKKQLPDFAKKLQKRFQAKLDDFEVRYDD